MTLCQHPELCCVCVSVCLCVRAHVHCICVHSTAAQNVLAARWPREHLMLFPVKSLTGHSALFLSYRRIEQTGIGKIRKARRKQGASFCFILTWTRGSLWTHQNIKVSERDNDLSWKGSRQGLKHTVASCLSHLRPPVSCQRPSFLLSYQRPWILFSSSMRPLLR